MRLIDADKLRQDVLDFPNCYNGFSDTYDKARIIDAIDEQPTIEERKKGKWLDDCGGVKCSVCGHVIDDPYYVEDYCTKCGSFNGEEEE